MTDFTHSFITNLFMIPPYDKYPHPPYINSITTILHLKSTQNFYEPSTEFLLNDIVTTPAGHAFKSFLQAVKEEEGYHSITWGPDLGEDSDLLLLISMSKQPNSK